MKVIVSRKSHVVMPSGETNVVQTLNSPFGNHTKVVSDDEAQSYVEKQLKNGFKVFVFDYAASFETQTTAVKVA